jgi:hypothetical protein
MSKRILQIVSGALRSDSANEPDNKNNDDDGSHNPVSEHAIPFRDALDASPGGV